MIELAVFTVLTFAATWAAWLASAHLAALPGFGLGGPIFHLGVFAPAIIALSLTARRGGRAAVGYSRKSDGGTSMAGCTCSRCSIWSARS
jgi:hypothetical protein